MNELKFNVRAPEHTKDSERDRVAARVVAELIRRGWHITFAESCTGGLEVGSSMFRTHHACLTARS
jgi:hypothetical protein